MLVLSRKVGERIVLGDRQVTDNDVLIEVLAVSGNKVKLGITAPSNVFAHREEVWTKIRGEDKSA